MSLAFLTGGGRDPDGTPQAPAPFARAVLVTGRDDVVVLGHGDDGAEWARPLEGLGLRPEERSVAPGRAPAVGDVAAVFVGGGRTPAHQEALCRDPSWLAPGAVYGGFSAGAAIAAEVALVGGWRSGGAAVCPEEAGEGLGEIELGLDEHTTLEVRDGAAVAVHGTGAAWLVEPAAAAPKMSPCAGCSPDG